MTTWQGLLRLDRERPWVLDAALALGLLAAALIAATAAGPVPVVQMVLMVAAAAGYELEGPDPALAGAAKVTLAGLFLRAVSYIDADRQR